MISYKTHIIQYFTRMQYPLMLFCLLVWVDQATKFLAQGTMFHSVIQNYLYIHFVYNDQVSLYRPLFGLLAILILFPMTAWRGLGLPYPLMIMISGGISNSVEALINGQVVDFIFVKSLDIVTNFADIFILVGAVFFIIQSIRYWRSGT